MLSFHHSKQCCLPAQLSEQHLGSRLLSSATQSFLVAILAPKHDLRFTWPSSSPASTCSCGGAGPAQPRNTICRTETRWLARGLWLRRRLLGQQAQILWPQSHVDRWSLSLHTKTSYQDDVFQILEAYARMDQIEKSYHSESGSRGEGQF